MSLLHQKQDDFFCPKCRNIFDTFFSLSIFNFFYLFLSLSYSFSLSHTHSISFLTKNEDFVWEDFVQCSLHLDQLSSTSKSRETFSTVDRFDPVHSRSRKSIVERYLIWAHFAPPFSSWNLSDGSSHFPEWKISNEGASEDAEEDRTRNLSA